MITGSTGFAVWIGDESGSAIGRRHAMPLFYCAFSAPSLMWLLPGREVPCSICNIPGMLTSVSITAPNDVGASQAAISTFRGLKTAGTHNSVVSWSFSPSQKWSAVSPHPGCVTLSSFNCLYKHLSMHCCTVLAIVPITQLGSSFLLNLPSSVTSSASSSSTSWLSKLARLLRLTLITTTISWNIVSGSLVMIPAFSAFLISSCFWLIAVSTSWTRFPATAVSLST